MSSLSDFNKRIKTIADTVERRAPVIVRMVAGAALQTVVMATPVGNVTLWTEQARRMARPGYVGGRARANWLVSVGSPRTETLDVEDAGGSETIDAGETVINGIGKDAVIYISNNLPYIIPLNEGHSHQAPAGFVERAVQAAIAALNGKSLTSGT